MNRLQMLLTVAILACLVYTASRLLLDRQTGGAVDVSREPCDTPRQAAPGNPEARIVTHPFVEDIDKGDHAEVLAVDSSGRVILDAVAYHERTPSRAIPCDNNRAIWRADERGVISIDLQDAPADGRFLLYARGFEHCRIPTMPAGKRQTITLRRYPAYTVTFIDAINNEPVRGVRLRLSSLAPSAKSHSPPAGLPGSLSPIHDYFSDTDGNIRITELPAGSYQAWMTHPSFLPLHTKSSFELTIDGTQTVIEMAEAYGFVVRVEPHDGGNLVEALYPAASTRYGTGTTHLVLSAMDIERRLLRRWPDADMAFVMIPRRSMVTASSPVKVQVRVLRGSHEARRLISAIPISKVEEPVVIDLTGMDSDLSRVRIEVPHQDASVMGSDHSWFYVVGVTESGRRLSIGPKGTTELLLPYGDYKVVPASGHLLREAFSPVRFKVSSPETTVTIPTARAIVRCTLSAGFSADAPFDDWILRVFDEDGKVLFGRCVWERFPSLWLLAGKRYTLECTVAGLDSPVLKTITLSGDEPARRVHIKIPGSLE